MTRKSKVESRKSETARHRELSHRALRWLHPRVTRRGLCGATEVRLASGYVADAFALCFLQSRFDRQYHPSAKTGEQIIELLGGGHVTLDEYDYSELGREYACVFEVKVSRPDFLSTFGAAEGKHANRHKPTGSLHWVVCPRGLVKPSEVPDFWGLLETSGSGLRETKRPKWFDVNHRIINRFAYALLWRKET